MSCCQGDDDGTGCTCRIAAARDKKQRKLQPYFDAPEALARRAKVESELALRRVPLSPFSEEFVQGEPLYAIPQTSSPVRAAQ